MARVVDQSPPQPGEMRLAGEGEAKDVAGLRGRGISINQFWRYQKVAPAFAPKIDPMLLIADASLLLGEEAPFGPIPPPLPAYLRGRRLTLPSIKMEDEVVGLFMAQRLFG